MKIYLNLFLSFLKIGLFSFGGGYGMIPLLKEEVLRNEWLTESELLDMIGISESTPGPIAINLATYLGYKKGGFFGALLATLGIIITPFVLMFCISLFLENILSNEAVKYAFMGIKVGVVFLLLKVSFTLVKNIKKDLFGILIMIVVTTTMLFFTIFAINFSAIYFILLGAVLGLLIYGIIPKKRGSKKWFILPFSWNFKKLVYSLLEVDTPWFLLFAKLF